MRISTERITSDHSKHHAWRVDPDDGGLWEVSWLPGRRLDRNQAITAIVLAETVNLVPIDGFHSDSDTWAPIDAWAAELGLSGPAAVTRVAVACLGV